MNVAERVWKVLKGDMPDRIPWLIYSNHLPRGSFERRMRDMGLGLDVRCGVYKVYTPTVDAETRTVGDYVYTTYRTPLGKVHSKRRTGLSFQFKGQGSWTVEYPVKNLEDLEVMKFIVKDMVYEPEYEAYLQTEDELEGDGIITVGADYTPLMKAIIGFMGFQTFAIMYRRHLEAVENLMDSLDKKYLEMYRIIAKSPAKIVRVGDNIDGAMISPSLFEKYCLPYYNKYADILKNASKVVISHMDGRLKSLKDLIAKTDLDAIEAFTPPPMGDLPVREAKESWRDKVVWINFPEEVFLRTAKEIKEYTLKLLEDMAPGLGYIVSITEDIHPAHFKKGIAAVTKTLHRNGRLLIDLAE